jgi:hypothetical protein
MGDQGPRTELCAAFSSPSAVATSWAEALVELEQAEVFWLSTVRPDGRPHVTSLLAVWWDAAMYFCTGPTEQKARNLADNPACALTTGRNALDGLDIVIEGRAIAVSDPAELDRVAGTYEAKYGPHFEAPDGTWSGLGDAMREGGVLVFRVAPDTAFGFGKGEPYSQTRWQFS